MRRRDRQIPEEQAWEILDRCDYAVLAMTAEDGTPYGLPLNVSSEVLIPRIDTEVLAERGILKARAAGEGARVLDLCAGSGCVGLAIAANAPGCRVVLGELAEGALRVCKQNVRRNELNARVTCLSVDRKSVV